MNNITFSLNKVSKAVAKQPLYRASVQSNVLIDHDELAERMAERTKQDAALWKYFIDILSDEIDNQLLEGNRIKLGRFVHTWIVRKRGRRVRSREAQACRNGAHVRAPQRQIGKNRT